MAFLDEIGLQYYDTKIKEYVTQQVGNAVGKITSFRYEVVTELPQTGEVGVVYLKALAEQESSNLYEEFIWVDNSYEFIGTNEVDLSGYYTKEETNKLVEDSAYTLPIASTSELGGIKVGENLTITDGVLSAIDTTYSASDFDIRDLSDVEGLRSKWDNKQDTIADLEAVKSGAALGATAVQESGLQTALNAYYTSGKTDELLATKQDVISDLESIISGATKGETALQPDSLNSYYTSEQINEFLNSKQEAISDLEAIREGASLGKTSVQSLDGYYTSSEIDSLVQGKQDKFTLGSNLELVEGVLSAVDTTYSNATETEAGLMSVEDKVKLDSLSNYELPADIQVSSISLTTNEGTTVSLTGDVLAQLLALIATE